MNKSMRLSQVRTCGSSHTAPPCLSIGDAGLDKYPIRKTNRISLNLSVGIATCEGGERELLHLVILRRGSSPFQSFFLSSPYGAFRL